MFNRSERQHHTERLMTTLQTNHDMIYVNGALTDVATTVDITAETITADLATKAHAAITSNQTFLDLAAPTNAQSLAQIKALTRQMTALIRLQNRIPGMADLILDNGGT
jgi:hypothetical protein